MKIKAVAGEITRIEADAVVVNLFEGQKRPGGATAAVDKALNGAISHLIKQGEIKGKAGEVAIIHTLGKLPARIVAVAGLGKKEDFNLDSVRKVAGDFSRSLRKLSCRRVATILHGAGTGSLATEDLAAAITEGSLLGLYDFTRYKSPNIKR